MTNGNINPIIPGFAPDPSVVRVDDTFFLVNSTFHLFPGLPIYVSKNLAEWKLIGNAINRPDQLSLADTRTNISPLATGGNIVGTGGLYAPTIRYHDGTYYILCTIVTHNDPPKKSHAFANFFIKTTDIYANNWSDPIYFDYYAFDPSLFFDDDGKAYVHGATMPGPKTTIDLFEIDLKTGARLSEQKTIWTGLTKFFPEGPHIYKKDGYYYCMIAEDGTHDFHAVKIARSKNLWGPYETYEKNPILTATGTDNYYNHLGHAELFQDSRGEWWCVCLGVRKINGRFVLGRETFITQASWPEGEWPVIESIKDTPDRLNGLTPQLMADNEDDELLFIREPRLKGYKKSNGRITLTPSVRDFTYATGHESISFVGKRQRALDCVASVTLDAISVGGQVDVQAGLGYFKDEHRFVKLFYNFSTSEMCFEMVNTSQNIKQGNVKPLDWRQGLEFCIKCTEREYVFSYRDSENVVEMGRVDTLAMTDFDFVGPVIGCFAFGSADTEVEFSSLCV